MDVKESFDGYVRARWAAWFRVAHLLTGDHHRAEDLVQQALLRVAGRWRQITANGDPDAYVKKVLYREHISRWRAIRRRVSEVRVTAPEAPTHDPSEAVVNALALRRALAELPARQRAVLVLRYYDDLSVAQTAELLDLRADTVRTYARDGLARLRSLGPQLADLTNPRSR
jgi:RNA polymerase sigma-70 factor (sigma-E family)